MRATNSLTVIALGAKWEGQFDARFFDFLAFISTLTDSYEVLIAEDHAEENLKLLPSFRTYTHRSPGYGDQLNGAIEEAKGEYLMVILDGRLPSLDAVKELWEMRRHADLIIGVCPKSKGLPGKSIRWLSHLIRRLLSLSVSDPLSPLRLYRSRIFTGRSYQSSGSQISLEILIGAVNDAYRLLEIQLSPNICIGSHTSVLQAWGLRSPLAWLSLWRLRNSVDAADYDSRAFDSRIPLQRYWQRKRYKIVFKFIGSRDGRILDIGCGSSRIIQTLPNAVAVDILSRKLRYLLPANKFRIQASTFSLPFRNSSFDLIIHSQVLEHIQHRSEIFSELQRLLKPDGILIIGTPDYGRIWWPIIEYFYSKILPDAYAHEHITHYTFSSLKQCLMESGFEIMEHQYICGGELIIKAKKGLSAFTDRPDHTIG